MFIQYKLPYEYDALEPHIDELTMETHYSKHHAAYTKNLNEAAEKANVSGFDITELLSSLADIPDAALRQTIRNNGGGFYNHNLYFSVMSPDGGGEPGGAFGALLKKEFGSFSGFQERLSGLAMGQFGSGWAWLSADTEGRLFLSASPNQDNPLIEGSGNIPVLGIDVWEHAYYLKYKNLRADYVKAFYNVINWKAVADNYARVTEK
ncbi:superoxide dismutase [Brucepastera parasyntrophica]|uniref:superoxide dismutase n=1 Tax=Brucepastera parasyntrophica TaxID=2880008 RepID=UPI00210CDCD0|nr:superoxide dismutase [Brucepastera parasyntrophica]ULQ58523.1 superoxide dismutase [Brucepastera parasyntrophica]